MKHALMYCLLILSFILTAASPVVAEEILEQFEQQCRTFAKEDDVAADDLAEYLQECVESLKEEDTNKQEKED